MKKYILILITLINISGYIEALNQQEQDPSPVMVNIEAIEGVKQQLMRRLSAAKVVSRKMRSPEIYLKGAMRVYEPKLALVVGKVGAAQLILELLEGDQGSRHF